MVSCEAYGKRLSCASSSEDVLTDSWVLGPIVPSLAAAITSFAMFESASVLTNWFMVSL